MTVTATYEDGKTKDVTSKATFTGYDMQTVSQEQTVTVSYIEDNVEKTATYTIQVKELPTLVSIALSGNYPTEFTIGDEFSHEGLVVTATYSDESTKVVTENLSISEPDMSTAGQKTVTVTYTEGNNAPTAEYAITVNDIAEKTIAEFIAAGGGKCYLVGTVSNIASTTYGNFDLTDASGTIYVYGCLTSEGESRQFASLGIEEGNKIKVLADQYTLYNQKDEAVNVVFVEKIALPTHQLAVVAENGSVTIEGKEAGVAANTYTIEEEFTVSATATPAEHYTFTGWTAVGVELEDNTLNPVSFTMPANDVTLTATFTENEKHTVTFSVLGEVLDNYTAEVYEGESITFPEVTAPQGFVFMGWTASAISGTQAAAPRDLTDASVMGSEDEEFYAVFAVKEETGDVTYEKLSSGQFEANATYVIGAAQSAQVTTMWYFYSYNDKVDENVSWGTMTNSPDENTPIMFTLSGEASSLVAMDSNNNYLSPLTTANFQMSGTSKTIAIDANDGHIYNPTKSGSDTYALRHNYNNGGGGLRWYKGNTGTAAYFYKVVLGITYSDYCTTLPTSETVSVTAVGLATYVSNYTLDYSNVDGLAAYKAKVSANGITFNRVTTVPAGEGVLLRSLETLSETKKFTVPVVVLGDNDNPIVWGEDENDFVRGTGVQVASQSTDETGATVNNYILNSGSQGVGFYKANNQVVATNRAYLSVSAANAPAGNNARLAYRFVDDVVTAISTVSTENSDNAVYNMQGQRVAKPAKGLYVVGGKKVVVK